MYIAYLLMCCVCAQSYPTLYDPISTVPCQAPLSMEFSRQEYWNELPFPSPGNLPNPGIELLSLSSPALAGGSFTTALPNVLYTNILLPHIHHK